MIVADEFRDGNVPAGMGNLRIIQRAVAAFPGKFNEIWFRGNCAHYEHDAMAWMNTNAIRYAISVRMSPQIKECIEALPENHWKPAGEKTDAIRDWAEIKYVPCDGNTSKDLTTPRHYLAIRIKPKQGELLSDGSSLKHFVIVTNRNDPDGGTGIDLIQWQRKKAGTIEHAHDVLLNELAGWCLPSQKFGANAAWLRINVLLYSLLSAFKRVSLPEEMHYVRPKRLRFLVLNTVGTIIRHARETLLGCADAVVWAMADATRVAFRLLRPALAGELGMACCHANERRLSSHCQRGKSLTAEGTGSMRRKYHFWIARGVTSGSVYVPASETLRLKVRPCESNTWQCASGRRT